MVAHTTNTITMTGIMVQNSGTGAGRHLATTINGLITMIIGKKKVKKHLTDILKRRMLTTLEKKWKNPLTSGFF